MNQKKVWKYLLVLCLLVGFVSSCGKEKGCTDATASNYDAEAEEDDASCIYGTCTDGIQNGTETGIDCGGSCDACGTPNTFSVEADGRVWEAASVSVVSASNVVITAMGADNSRLELTIEDDAVGAHNDFSGKYIPVPGGSIIYVTASTEPRSLEITESGNGKLSGTFSGMFKYSNLQGQVMSIEFTDGTFYELDY